MLYRNGIEHDRINVLLSTKVELSEKRLLKKDSIEYLQKLLDTFHSIDSFDIELDCYTKMMEIAGPSRRTKICQDIRQCIINLNRNHIMGNMTIQKRFCMRI